MLSIFKKLFSKSSSAEAPPSSTSARRAGDAPLPAAPKSPTPGVPGAPVPAPGPPAADAIPITLETVVATMPDSLKKRLDKKLNGSEKFFITRAEAMRQLPSGAVKLPFREIVRMVPNTFLSPDEEMLNTQVTLPLQEILPKIKNLPRRAAQQQVEVPTDLDPLFGPTGQPHQAKSAAVPAPPPSSGTTFMPKPAPVAPPPPAPLPVPKPEAPKEEAYVPPPPKPLEAQAPISFKTPGTQPATPAPAPAPSPTPATAQIPRPVAAPSPPGVTPPGTAQIARQVAAPSPPGVTPPKAAFSSAPPSPVAAVEGPTISLGEVFGQPAKKDWTPQEVVEKTAALRGVAGALITTADGLPVAFQLPENLNGNVIGAFVPQMYTRITQYTRDLKLGDARHITITVENTPLQIFKSGNIYFTALGKAGENLPKPQLTAIASALGRQI
jgi:predicted regulator of Ras-like GTPase activity (Roadblock/LC7/MglB family)